MGRIAPGATARLAEALFVKTSRPAPRDYEVVFLASATRSRVRAAGQDIAVYHWGDADRPAVLFAHGWWSHAGRFAPLATALLNAGLRAVSFDAPGHGRSSGWRASMPEFGAALRAVGDADQPLRAVIGHSLGGSAAILALTRGLGAARAVTIAAPSDIPGWAHQFRDMFSIPPKAYQRMRTNLEKRLQFSWDELEIPALARRLAIPGLVVHDVHDPDVPWVEAQAIADSWRGAELMLTEGLGHRQILRDPAVIERVVRFVAAS